MCPYLFIGLPDEQRQNFCEIIGVDNPSIKVHQVCCIVSEVSEITLQKILSKSRQHEVVRARQIAQYIGSKATNITAVAKYTKISRETMYNSIKKVENAIETNDKEYTSILYKSLERLENSLIFTEEFFSERVKFSKEELDKIFSMNKSGKTFQDISRHVGSKPSIIKKYIDDQKRDKTPYERESVQKVHGVAEFREDKERRPVQSHAILDSGETFRFRMLPRPVSQQENVLINEQSSITSEIRWPAHFR